MEKCRKKVDLLLIRGGGGREGGGGDKIIREPDARIR